MKLIENLAGNYRFLKGIDPYSSGVVAAPGFEIIHVRLQTPLPLHNGAFQRIIRYLKEAGRPLQSLCALQLRMPKPLSFAGFKEFNENYQNLLAGLGLLLPDVNPIARTNIASVPHMPDVACLYAFSYTIPSHDVDLKPTFIIAGAGDLKDQTDLRPTSIIRPGETSSEAVREKASTVLKVMQERLSGIEGNWHMVSAVNVYTLSPIHLIMNDLMIKTIGPAARHGINWSYGVPPIIGLDFEMDIRSVRKEIVA